MRRRRLRPPAAARAAPAARPLDDRGLACAAGFVPWPAVQAIRSYQTVFPATGRRIVVELAPGAEPEPAEGRFLDNPIFGRCRRGLGAVTLPAWTGRRQALETIRRFYAGPADI